MFDSICTVRAYGDLYYTELSGVRRFLNSICVLIVCAARTHSSQSAKHWLWCHQLFYDRWFLMVIKNEIKEKLNKIMSLVVFFCLFFLNSICWACLVSLIINTVFIWRMRIDYNGGLGDSMGKMRMVEVFIVLVEICKFLWTKILMKFIEYHIILIIFKTPTFWSWISGQPQTHFSQIYDLWMKTLSRSVTALCLQ